MSPRKLSLRLSIALFVAVISPAQTKRPLNHNDYDGWKSITSQKLSNNGKFLAYGLFPQDGDGQVVIRNLVTGKEHREQAGARPAPPLKASPEEGATLEARSVTIAFSSDSKSVVFSTFPGKEEIEKARKEKKTGDQAPKDGMVIFDLDTGKATRIERVKRFQMPGKAAGVLAYLKEAAETKAAPAARDAAGDADQQGRRGRGARPEFGSDLVLRKLADSSERTFADVVEFALADDGAELVYSVSAHDTARNGVFAVRVNSPGAPAALLAGKGKYARLTWNEEQTRLAFVSDRDDSASKQPRWKLYGWDRQPSAASELASAGTPGFRSGFAISDKGNLSFSKDGTRVYFGCAPSAPEKPADTDTNPDDKASVDLWSYKDDYINPIQKVHADATGIAPTWPPTWCPTTRSFNSPMPRWRTSPLRKTRNGRWAATTAGTAPQPIGTSITRTPT